MAGVMKPSPGALRIIDDLEGGLAIVCNGNTAPKNISAGQYLFIKNHSTLPTGGYHATAAISSGGTISSSNVATDADGISNALNSNLTALDGDYIKTFGTSNDSGSTIPAGTVIRLKNNYYQGDGIYVTKVDIPNGYGLTVERLQIINNGAVTYLSETLNSKISNIISVRQL